MNVNFIQIIALRCLEKSEDSYKNICAAIHSDSD